MPRFIVRSESIQNHSVTLNHDESRHALKVLRLGLGHVVDLIDGEGRSSRGVVASVQEGQVQIALNEEFKAIKKSFIEVTLGASIIKSDRMEWLLEKSCELGIASFQPLLAQRSVVKLSSERWRSKIERWKRIAKESCKQCGLPRIPDVHEPRPMTEFVKQFASFDLVLIPTLNTRTENLFGCLDKHSKARKVLLLVGPEGDFTPEEVRMAMESGAQAVSLGELILRSETASIYTLSALNFFYSRYYIG